MFEGPFGNMTLPQQVATTIIAIDTILSMILIVCWRLLQSTNNPKYEKILMVIMISTLAIGLAVSVPASIFWDTLWSWRTLPAEEQMSLFRLVIIDVVACYFLVASALIMYFSESKRVQQIAVVIFLIALIITIPISIYIGFVESKAQWDAFWDFLK